MLLNGRLVMINRKIAQLESRIDYLETEFRHLNDMLVNFGFDEGIKTLAHALDEAMDINRLYSE